MEGFVKKTLLFDFYGDLLTEHQQRIYKDAVFDDLSISEIADNEGITRQGVHDMIRRCNKALDEYESRLHLVEKFLKIREQVKIIKKLSGEEANTDEDGKTPGVESNDRNAVGIKSDTNISERFSKIDKIASGILEEL